MRIRSVYVIQFIRVVNQFFFDFLPLTTRDHPKKNEIKGVGTGSHDAELIDDMDQKNFYLFSLWVKILTT